MSDAKRTGQERRVPPERTSLADILSDQFDLWKVRQRIALKRELMKAMVEEQELNDQIRAMVTVRLWSDYLQDPTKIRIDVEPPIHVTHDADEEVESDDEHFDDW
jgi:hypothetical protein